MKFYLKREHIANTYFLNIMARISKGLNPKATEGVENLNIQIFKELGVDYENFKSAKNNAVIHKLIDTTSPDYAFLSGLENLVEDGVAFYLERHGHTIEANTSDHALKIAVEALKDEFEGENGETMEVSDNGDTNSGVIQAILDDLKNRQADEVGRTVNLILKLNADKQRELLDEQQANSDEIDETINETGLTGSDTDEELNEGENPLENDALDKDDEGENASFEDDPFADGDDNKNNDKKSKSAEEDAPTLKDKKDADKKDANSGNPFEGFESMMLNGFSPLDSAGNEAGGDLGSGLKILMNLLSTAVNPSIGLLDFITGNIKYVGAELYEALKSNYKSIGWNVIEYMGLDILSTKLTDFRLEKSLSSSQNKLANAQGSKKGMLHMTSNQYQKAYKTYHNEMNKILKEIQTTIKKDEILSAIQNRVQKEDSEYMLLTIPNTTSEASNIGLNGIFDLSCIGGMEKNNDLKAYVPQVKKSYNNILALLEEKLSVLKSKRSDFIPFVNPMSRKENYILTIGFVSNVIVSEAFTESEFTDIVEGMAETLGESDASLSFRFMNDLNTQVGNEDQIGRVDSLYQDGNEAILSPFEFLFFTFRLALKKIKKYKLGENILRKNLSIPEDDYNKELKEMENIIKANSKYLEGALRSKSKFLTWCLDVGAIKVLPNPQFVDGLALVVAIDTINPIEVDKENKKLKYKSSTIDLSEVGVSKYKLMPFKNLGVILVKACEDVNKIVSDVLKQRLDAYKEYAGINPVESENSDSGWVVVAHNLKQAAKPAIESLDPINGNESENDDIAENICNYDAGTEGIISVFKNKWNSVSVIKPSIEMTSNEYQSLVKDFKTYGKECLETLKVDIKNDDVIGLLGLDSYLNSTFEVKQDAKKRPMVTIYKTDKGLVPTSYWEKNHPEVKIRTQNSKIEKLIKVIKSSIEAYIAETKFKGLSVFPVISKDLTEAYAVIANPIKLKAESSTESIDLFTKFQPISAGFEKPMYGTESYLEMKEDYKLYNNILNILKIGNLLSSKLKEKAEMDYVFGDRSYQACVESFITDPNKLIKELKCENGYIEIPIYTLDPSKTSTMYKNEFVIEATESLKSILNENNIDLNKLRQVDIFNPNGVKNLIYTYIELGTTNSGCESLYGEDLLSKLADNYLVKDYHDDIVMEQYQNDNGKYGVFGLESELQTYLAEDGFKVMSTAYYQLTRNGMNKLKAEFYMNNLYKVGSTGVESLMNTLSIDQRDASVMSNRSKYLTFEYLKESAESAIRKYSAESIYNTIKGYMQKSLDINGVDGIAYEPKYGLLIGLESSNDIKYLAKKTIKLQKEHSIPEYMFMNAIGSNDGTMMNVLTIPLSLGTESLRDIPQILREVKSALKEIEDYTSLKSVSDISIRNIFGFKSTPLAGTESQLQEHIKHMMIGARGETLKLAYNQYGVESYEFKNIQNEFEKSINNVFTAYLTSICLASRLGMNVNVHNLYQKI